DNNTSDPEALTYLEKLAHKHRILKFPEAFNWSKINNFGAANCEGEYLLFLNNDIEVKESEWLTAMLEQAQRPEIGVVGAKLLHPDGTVQHVGMILGMGDDHAGHLFHSIPKNIISLGVRLQAFIDVPRNFSAVTGACMMVRREVFEQLGGFDPGFRIAYGDVDFCLRIGQAGYRVVYTPLAELLHHECATRKGVVPPEDREYMWGKWGERLKSGDPYYNPNLDLTCHDFSLSLS
ncbi:glycosyltransferase family 2 protein, partial [Candidatus Woesearchaeota archaeon]